MKTPIQTGSPLNAMSDDELSSEESQAIKIARYRQCVLVQAGYSETNAWELALAPYVDLHIAVELVEQKHCPATVATKILL